MSGAPALDEDAEDAAFRARLAPLSAEVLPHAPAPALDARQPSPRTRGEMVFIAAMGLMLVAGGALVYAAWPGSPPASSQLPTAQLSTAQPPKLAASMSQPSVAAPVQSTPVQIDEDREMVALLLHRGQAALAVNDIAAARMLYERAADMGSAAAATVVGKTYDIAFLLDSGARGIPGDRVIAAAWYRKAVALGDAEAKDRLARIDGAARP